MEDIQIPDWFKVGLKFSGKWIKDMNCEVVSFNTTTNLLSIKLSPDKDAPSYRQSFTEDGWNLKHTLNGFDKGEYLELIEEID